MRDAGPLAASVDRVLNFFSAENSFSRVGLAVLSIFHRWTFESQI